MNTPGKVNMDPELQKVENKCDLWNARICWGFWAQGLWNPAALCLSELTNIALVTEDLKNNQRKFG